MCPLFYGKKTEWTFWPTPYMVCEGKSEAKEWGSWRK